MALPKMIVIIPCQHDIPATSHSKQELELALNLPHCAVQVRHRQAWGQDLPAKIKRLISAYPTADSSCGMKAYTTRGQLQQALS